MRVVIDARESGTSTGRYVDKLIEYLHKLKPEYEIIVLAKSHRLSFLKEIAPAFKTVKSDFKEFTFAEQLGFLRQVKSLKADLVHFTMTQQPVRYKGKKITTVHDLTTVRFKNPSKNAAVFKAKQQVYKTVVKRVAKTSAVIITPSEYVKKDLASFSGIKPSKIQVTYEAADSIKARPEAISRLVDKQFIMYVGRPTPHKNLPRLVRAFELLKKKHPKLMLVFVGKIDANYKQLEKLVSDKWLADSVVFTDFIDEGQLRWLYENTTAYVFPSLSEGFGLPPLEAMMHGAPVVSSSATCLPEVNGDGAIYFNPKNTIEMAQKIDKVISDPNTRNRLIKNGHIQVAKYSWQRMAEQTLEIYKDVLK